LTASLAQVASLKDQLGTSTQQATESGLQVELLNRQLLALRDQLGKLTVALDASEAKAKSDEVQVFDLGKRLNEALASKVEELARYRSEFFGKLREVLGNRPDVQIVGDRFIFQSEVLFATGSADIGEDGKHQLAAFADTLKSIAVNIPTDIDWLLRVDGHTDKQPYNGPYGGNWELSTARAIAVVKFLIDQGIPPNRLVAAGFGEFRPLVDGDSQEDFRRNRRIELKLDQR
jgi:chemotaxis protein MotB